MVLTMSPNLVSIEEAIAEIRAGFEALALEVPEAAAAPSKWKSIAKRLLGR